MMKSLRRLLLHWFHSGVSELEGGLGALRSCLDSPRQAVFAWPDGQAALGPNVALFIHFDRQGAVRQHVLDYLAALRAAGLSVVFVSNAGRLRPEALAALQAVCAAILVRRNIGYDFGAMREGLEHLGLPRPDTELLVIANDSVYGPLRPFDDVLARVDFDRADLWGATESWQRRYHLQSYFLVAGPKVMRSPAWQAFWQGVRPVRSKHWVVSRYEVGLTQTLLQAGLRCAALWPYQDLVERLDTSLLDDKARRPPDPFIGVRRKNAERIRDALTARLPLNPTAELWRQLLEAGFPFIKRELLQKNPARIADIAEWRHVVRDHLGGDVSQIEQDLQRVLRNRAS